MSLTKKEVADLAMLARVELDDVAIDALADDLNTVLVHLNRISELDLDGVEPMTHAVPLVNATRPDELRPSLPQDIALKNAPAQEGGAFLVPRIAGPGGGA